MDCRVDGDGKLARCRLAGEIDLETSPQVRTALLEQVRRGCSLVVNMAAVESIDSSGLASLVEAYQRTQRAGLRFTLEAVGEKVLRVLSLARLDTVFPIVSHQRAG